MKDLPKTKEDIDHAHNNVLLGKDTWRTDGEMSIAFNAAGPAQHVASIAKLDETTSLKLQVIASSRYINKMLTLMDKRLEALTRK